MPEENRPPSPPIRRIVTGHDGRGKSVVATDGPAANHKWPGGGIVSTLIWSTHECPAEMWTGEDFGARIIPTQPPPMGSRFCVIDFAPGNRGHMHRTDTVDYVMCLAGEIDMEMDETTVRLKAGDLLVQQGTNHSWLNRGSVPARLAFALIDGKPPPGGALAIAAPMPPTPAADPPPDLVMRRVVTSHDARGKAVVMWDGPAPGGRRRPRGNTSTLIWGSDETPAETWTREDFGARASEIEPGPRGTWFRVLDYPPGTPGRMHRTDTVDYVICLAGEMVMLLDDSSVTMRAGDVMVQQGTDHSWENRSEAPARIAFVLLDAKKKPGAR